MAGPPSPFVVQRERARRVATQTVSFALGLAGVALVVLAVTMVVRAGPSILFLAVVIGLLGIAIAAAGFFFQLVPLRVDELADQKRDEDRRLREG